jgi:hypothetical protein
MTCHVWRCRLSGELCGKGTEMILGIAGRGGFPKLAGNVHQSL